MMKEFWLRKKNPKRPLSQTIHSLETTPNECNEHKLMFGIFKMFVSAHFSFYWNYFLIIPKQKIYESNEAQQKKKQKPNQNRKNTLLILPSKCVSVFFFKHRSFRKCHSACKMRFNLICWLPHTHIEHGEIEASSFIDKQYRTTRY